MQAPNSHGNHRLAAPGLPPGIARACFAALLLAALSSHAGAHPQDAPRQSVDDVLLTLQQKFKQDEGKYADLARRMDKAVRAAIDAQVWLEPAADGAGRHFSDHPSLVLAAELAEAAKSDAKKRTRNSPESQKLLALFPWSKDLELVQGLQYGSDRAIPDHENGFVALGSVTQVTSLLDVPVNQYLYGFGEIVGWQYRVKAGKRLAYEGRTPKDPPVMSLDLPSWEKLRVYLQGTLPEVPLFAIPWLTHRIHSRLAERRRANDDQPVPMDEMLALMDSHWNGFHFQVPYSKERIAIAAPVRELYADRKGFLYQFPRSARLESVGDMPFISILTLQQYAQLRLDERIDPEDFIVVTEPAGTATSQFQADNAYLVRYKSLIDEIVRAIVAPNSPYPAYLANFDFRSGKAPEKRAVSGRFDVPRKYAVLLWAWSGKDPVKLADFLHDNLLGTDQGRFPSDTTLQQQLATVVRAQERALMTEIVERIARDRAAGQEPGDFEREFSPYPAYLTTDGQPHSDYLLFSFQAFHAEATELVREAAYRVVVQEVP